MPWYETIEEQNVHRWQPA